ncbi:MAG TPA: hypothetical protein GX514_09175 [Thermoanaerobacterales bacterium]|nr:hypothetical protein [Thermoanaerobacterales bacterium]
MAKIAYFQPPEFRSVENRMLLKYVPTSSKEGYKADIVKQKFSEELYIRYLALTIVHEAYQYLPKQHQELIRQLVNYGVFDELAVKCGTNLTNCYISNNTFFYNGIEIELPAGYTPKVRMIDDETGNIYVEAFNSQGKRRVYQFLPNQKGYTWRRIDNKPVELLVDF